jgi:O-antigen/teichoic acid export membrane protein
MAASVLSQSNYGLLEWSLSFAMMLSLFISLGSGGVLSFEVIKHETNSLINTTLFYIVFLSFLLGIFGSISIIFFEPSRFSYILGFTGIFIGQFALSAYLKAKGKGAYASIIESFIYIIILFLVFNSIFQGIKSLEFLLVFPFFTIVLSIILFFLITDRTLPNKKDLSLFLQRGFPIMISSFLSVGFINLPRALLGSYDSFDSVAVFSLYFRWAAIALVAYQFVLVMNFRKIYTYSYEKLDRYIVTISFIVLLIGCCIILGLEVIKKYDIPFHLAVPQQDILIQSLMAGVITLWAIGSSLEGLFYREHLSKFQIYASVFGIVAFLLNIWLLHNFVSNMILIFAFSWFISYIVIVISQLLFLQKSLNIKFLFTRLFIIIMVISILLLLMELL